MQDRAVYLPLDGQLQSLADGRVYVDDMIVLRENGVCDEFFHELKERFPVKHQGELKIYTGCAFECDWENGTLLYRNKRERIGGKPDHAVWNHRCFRHSG